jgi:transposase-like protein
METPKTLQAAILFFGNPDNCVAYMRDIRWPDGVVVCPTCGRNDVSWLATQKKWQCKSKHTKRQFSAKVGTIFEDSPLSLDKWLMAGWMLANCKNGVSSYEIARSIGVTQKSAWFMLQRLRLATQDTFDGGKLDGVVEVDETFIGGKARNMHTAKRKKVIQGRGATGKTVVMGMLERGGKVRAHVIEGRDKKTLHSKIAEHVEPGAHVMTDELVSYWGLEENYTHSVINHAEKYVDGLVSTNGMENFWSLLKRGLNGTYVAVEPFHLFRYIDEQAFRFNNRIGNTDATRFTKLISQVAGRRLTYAEVTGKVAQTAV